MTTHTLWLVTLTPLFTSLLSGCVSTSSCDGFKGGTYKQTIELTQEDYAQWQMGMSPQPTTGATASESSGSSESGSSGETGGSSDTGDTASTGTSATTGGASTTPLTDDEICHMVCTQDGASDLVSCSIGAENANGNIPVECEFTAFCEGRRHACVRSRGEDAASGAAAAWLARAAHDEAASVHAFTALARELAAHGAPAQLLAAISAAAADEVRHARVIATLASERGATLRAPEVVDTPVRDLLAIAVENAVEGCVLETWAALSAAHQAVAASDPQLRSIFATIAADEARHAELAWAIDAWLGPQLGAAEQALVLAARHAAARQLRARLAAGADAPELLALGVPDRAAALHLAAGLDAALWARAA